MYHENHPVFEKPEDENIKIWRYLDFTKFVSMLDKKALFFSSVNNLDDPLEGSYTEADRVFWSKHTENWQKMLSGKTDFKKMTTVNCWHINEHESAAMWKLYLKTNEGIAIQSSFRRLKESFYNDLEEDVYIGKVKYINYRIDETPKFNVLYPFMHKRISFEYEKELRALIPNPPLPNKDYKFVPHDEREDDIKKWEQCVNERVINGGLYVPVNLDILIEKIVVSPTAFQWFTDLIYSIVIKYNLNKEVKQSSLAEDQIY